jgi:hypothetical protein
MQKELCPFYKEARRETHSRTIQGGRNPRKPTITTKKYCSHPESKHRLETLSGDVQCDGDLERCSISPED